MALIKTWRLSNGERLELYSEGPRDACLDWVHEDDIEYIDPRSVPIGLLKLLGASVSDLVEHLARYGVGIGVHVPTDPVQQLENARRIDEELDPGRNIPKSWRRIGGQSW